MIINSHYKSNLNDIFFNLFTFLKMQDDIFGNGKFSNIDEETAREILKSIEKLSIEKISTSFKEGDQVELKLDDNGNVTLPIGIKKSIEEFYNGDWHLLDAPKHLGGMGAPRSLHWAVFEMLSGANPSVALYLLGSTAAKIIDEIGTNEQKNRFKDKLIQEQWGATMVLTEADAGSDVGAGTTKAKHIKNDLYEISGIKRFITNGDFDYPNNIMHIVLARPEGAENGTKGLSLFLVPKIWINGDGTAGKRNGVFCTNIEKKMGIKASATCEMTFGKTIPAKGLLLGNVHEGIRQMFLIIEQARMAVGVKSMSTLSTAYLNSLEFCKERIQGTDLSQIFDKSAHKVAIIKHPDIRRMLMLQKSHTEGMRALCMYCSYTQDLITVEKNEDQINKYKKLVDLLLPLIKGYNSEKVYELLSTSLQCFGGSGYLKDYPLEQYIRDQKIDSLYEGTTHIQSLDLVFRKIAKDAGKTLGGLLSKIKKTCKNRSSKNLLSTEYDLLTKAVSELEIILSIMMKKIGESLYYIGLNSNKILESLSEVIISWLMIKQSETIFSLNKKISESEKLFYDGKIASTKFYCSNVLPKITSNRYIIENSKLDLMKMSDESF